MGFFLLCEEESKRNADEDTDAALTDEPETRDDELLDPLAVQALPEVDQGFFAQGLAAPAPLGPAPLRSWSPLRPFRPWVPWVPWGPGGPLWALGAPS